MQQLLKLHTINALAALGMLAACGTDKQPSQANPNEQSLPPAKVAKTVSMALLDSLTTASQRTQHFSIDPSKPATVRARRGATLYIAPNSLLDEKGQPLKTSVNVEIKEQYTFADYVASNLQTVQDTTILQTQGMLYFFAKTQTGKQVRIDKTKPIRLELPVAARVPQAKIYKGYRDARGTMNWTQPAAPSKYLIPYPIHIITRQPNFFTECNSQYGITKDTVKYDGHNLYGKLSDYENTFMATREFRQRYYCACWPQVVRLYAANITKNLWEADELVVKFFIADSAAITKELLHWKPVLYKGSSSRQEQLQAHASSLREEQATAHFYIETFKNFAKQKLTVIDPLYQVSDSVVTKVQQAFIAYDALEFGWVNVDYLYDDPAAREVKLAVKTVGSPEVLNLLIPSRNIMLSAAGQSADGSYLFTKKQSGYNKLPKGEKAILLAMGLVNNKLTFAEKKIIIGKNELEQLELQPISAAAVKAKLKSYSK